MHRIKNLITLPAGLTLPIWHVGNQWAVTGYGLERIDGRYEIDAKGLAKLRRPSDEQDPYLDWFIHLAETKSWFDPEDFTTAFRQAVRRFPKYGKPITYKLIEASSKEACAMVARRRLIDAVRPDVEAELYPERAADPFKLWTTDEIMRIEKAAERRAVTRYGCLPECAFP